ncbi:hypothetical protein SAMN05421810_109226 [Amycolatopsis arida]|uniref:Uncharacterized protein n=1 Tax=Amycolatopsis arida TaxID=587909 RepID=A0A1I5ZIN0_9PSEU|nr:hypothetical protein [Amycolatopsis arida]TDX89705.1 hypothetical protein CLV69_109226 [Amycolatopsis arida]SFQ56223.1 hypothetical protein SAMN05421810_109226 [Amycolatopsis arida]
MCCPSATLSVWSAAWLGGAAAADDTLDALLAWGEAHEVVAADPATADALGLPVAGSVPAPPAELLTVLRRLAAHGARLVLPVAGDVRGLGGPGPLTDAALKAGEATVFPSAGYGAVPQPVAEGLLRWTVYPMAAPVPPEHVGLGEAEHDLTEAIRVSAGELRSLDVARERPGVRDELSARLRARPRLDWPPRTPGRALRVLQRADEVGAILALAAADEPGGAMSASAAGRRAAALRPLADAVRRARCAAVAEAVRVFSEQADPRP